MNKPVPRSEWEDVPGFNRDKREYIRLDGESWLAAHRIRTEGKQRGHRNQPGPNETVPDEMYHKIESWVRKRALDCKEEVGKYVNEELAFLHDRARHATVPGPPRQSGPERERPRQTPPGA